jgi:hypothetical protein
MIAESDRASPGVGRDDKADVVAVIGADEMNGKEVPACSLAELLELEVNPRRVWQPHELAAVLHHQLHAPLQVELGELRLGVTDPDAAEAGLALMSFGDLLHHPRPPVQVLEMVKDFAKFNLSNALAPLPREVATVLYFCSILIAMSRCGRSITALQHTSVVNGVEWVLMQPWVEPSLKALCQEALVQIGPPPSSSGPVPADHS